MQKKLSLQGVEMNYDDIGSGAVVLLIHGFAEDRRIWDGVIPALDRYRLIIPDLPGSGNSGLPAELSIESMADAVVALFHHEQIPEAIIIGHSMGGYITLAVAENHPQVVKACGVVDSTAVGDCASKRIASKKDVTIY